MCIYKTDHSLFTVYKEGENMRTKTLFVEFKDCFGDLSPEQQQKIKKSINAICRVLAKDGVYLKGEGN